ncbi:ABC transporter substrate-binding protein [Paracraurococcus lichenis]|uniref:ABC transporter substrate-binding protein n=1 Tax=Paracraurococcus lichenis TaxID=3064888 RepID=A0ABT9E0E7_9PROT|nr:ABC transporter substrate-binding protein [Paracraurococcus sp. LOR1-02]MDO9709621.1 ABC transporter substrate-binding protein [Paracraurococcus sp. LOR1-02]
MRRTALAALLLAGLTGPALAQREPGALTIGIGGAVTSIDPHFYNAAPNNSLAMHIFDRLVERDARAQPYPGLAEGWRTLSETVWEFRLRPGVTWHDGRAFTAEDVAFTIARAPNVPGSPGGFGGFVRAIETVEIVDPLTIRFHTARPHPLLPTELASVAIVSKHAGEGAATEDYNSGKAAIGTGPYRMTAYRPGDRTELARNEAWFRGPEPWARVTYRFIGNDGARTAALLAGDVDIIDQVPSTDLARLRRDGRVTVAEVQGLRLIYLVMDHSRTREVPFVSDNDGKPLPANPFLDLRVRRALSMAINRAALTERVMEGTAQPAGQWLVPGTFGYNPEVTPPAFDPEGAKRLLAEAGYPQGFRMTLHTPNDRYPNDAKAAQAVAQMFTRIGIRTEVEAAPWASFSLRSSRQDYAIRLSGWGSVTGEASYTLVNILSSFDREKRTGASNVGRYSNPELDALTARAAATIDDAQREALLREAVKLAMDDVAIIPMFQLVNTWALRKGLRYEARMDERTTAMAVRPER